MRFNKAIDGLLWASLGGIICIGSFELKLGELSRPGAGFLPFVIGAILSLLGISRVIFNILIIRYEEKEANENQNKVAEVNKLKNFYLPSLTLFTVLLYALLVEILGFLLTTFLFLIILFKISEPQKWVLPIFLSAVTAILSYLLFSIWLQGQFPKGILNI